VYVDHSPVVVLDGHPRSSQITLQNLHEFDGYPEDGGHAAGITAVSPNGLQILKAIRVPSGDQTGLHAGTAVTRVVRPVCKPAMNSLLFVES
jgi:hypothetical protein